MVRLSRGKFCGTCSVELVQKWLELTQAARNPTAFLPKCRNLIARRDKLRLLAVLGLVSFWFPQARFVFAFVQGAADADQQFQSAVAHYEARQYQLAEHDLKELQQRFPDDFEVDELLGQVYIAMGDDKKASPLLQKAAILRPDVAIVRLRLAANLFRLRENSEAESEFKKAVELDPQSFEANRDLGEFYAATGRLPAAIPFLESARRINPSSTVDHDLALAYFKTQNLTAARNQVYEILKINSTAESHNLLAQIEESSGHYTEAAKEYEQAARMDPNENYIFDWGYELLLHRTFEPATSVFTQGTKLHPRSVKLQIGLGIALYSRGRYDDALEAFCHATDLAPLDPRPYIYLGKALNVPSAHLDEAVQRLQRFTRLQTNNPQAYYYYALSLLAQSRSQNLAPDYQQIEGLLTKAINLAPRLFDAHLRLAVLCTDQHRYAEAVGEYRKAIALQPNAPEPHYRLGQVYARMGEKTMGEKELRRYNDLQKQQEANSKEQSSETQEFMFTLK